MKRKLHFLLATLFLTAIYMLLPGCDLVPKPPLPATATPPASLQPGLQLTLQALPYADQVTPVMLAEARSILEKRAMAISTDSFAARVEDTDRIVVEVRGNSDMDELVKTLSQTGYMEFVDGGVNPPDAGTLVATSTGGPDVGNGSPTPSHTYQTIISPEEIDAEKTQVSINPTTNTPEVDFVLKGDGPQKLADFTTASTGHFMPIVLDKQVINAPRIVSPITGGKGVITGLTLNDAKRLVAQLRAGMLPVRLRLLDSKAIGGPNVATPIPTGKPAPNPVETARPRPTTTQHP